MEKRSEIKEFITIKYYEIVELHISVLVDSDIGFYHTFDIGDIICVEENRKVKTSTGVEFTNKKLKIGWLELINPRLYQKIGIDNRTYAFDVGVREFMIDVTKKIDRNKKLEKLGI
jgi:hypothetical protein